MLNHKQAVRILRAKYEIPVYEIKSHLPSVHLFARRTVDDR